MEIPTSSLVYSRECLFAKCFETNAPRRQTIRINLSRSLDELIVVDV